MSAVRRSRTAETAVDARLAEVLRWLDDHAGWLLIVDNVDDPATVREVQDLLARLRAGHVLITSRVANWRAGVEPLELHLLAEADAVAFLLDEASFADVLDRAHVTGAAVVGRVHRGGGHDDRNVRAVGAAKDEVDRMVKEAQSHAADDQQRREFIDAKNQADSLAYQVEKTINEHREKLPVGDLSRVEAAIAEVRKRSEGDDVQALRKAIDDLQHASHAIAQTLYANHNASAGPGGPRSSTGSSGSGADVKDGEVIDAEYQETGA